MEEQVCCFGLEGDVSDFLNDQEGVPPQAAELVLTATVVVGFGEAVDPLGGGSEQDAVPGLAGADRDTGGEVGFAGAWWAEEDHVVFGGDEVQGAQVGDRLAFEAASVLEVEVLEGLVGRKAGGADAAFSAVGLPCADLPLETRGKEILVSPG